MEKQRVGFETGGAKPKRKAPYTPKHRITKDMEDSQRAGSERWNLFVDILQENGLMEEK
ncbi:hypothetical protein [Paenibacillus sp. BIHB 4019]|uniref:hypothetical protein n=1 Tax=Paenibacillus sp. BIHB 4019 TaxID=1870819 RepID=UPI001559A0FE|nr:hypothetical protein [Paenibacillus sp. BIHB 4019]